MVYPLLTISTGSLSDKDSVVKENLLPEHFEHFFRFWEIKLKLRPETFKEIPGGLKYSTLEKTIMKVSALLLRLFFF